MWNRNRLFKLFCVCCHVHEAKFKMNRTIKDIQEAAPLLKNLLLIFLLCQLIIDILKLNHLCIVIATYSANAILKHTVKGNVLLVCSGNTIIFLSVFNEMICITLFWPALNKF